MLDLLNAAEAQLAQVGPVITQVLASDLARPLTLTRFGQAGVPVRALLGEEEDRSSIGPDIDAPEVASRTFTALLPPLEVARTLGWMLTDGTGRVFVPVAVPLDPGGRGFCLVARVAPLPERTRVHDLVFQVPSTGTVIQPGTGNQVPAPPTPFPIQARLSATTDPRIRDSVGADAAEVVLIGRWGSLTDPKSHPPSLRWGLKAPLSLQGQSGTLTLKLASPDEDLATEAQFGGRFLALWSTP
ncbi:hypothetical protein GO986_16185 [Deinococcus sp. HMF7620]|uniref:Uncharacterized protein n=1 Tax=Deinococcus arboris TaxID=2682977 RepID=A0A7C9M822_9DEIO|nr:hypothetical protein [Deinococcus arboris]MVN88285.1 hypothetical protein [Deinococcus arboris]